MIGVNPLRRPLLITTDEVIFHAPTANDVDVRVILNSIIVAEVRFIKPLLGHTIYSQLVESKNLLVTESNLSELQEDISQATPTGREDVRLKIGDYVNSDTYLTTQQLDLWQNYLHKIVAECVWFTAMPVNRTRFNSAGIEQVNPQSAVSDRGSATADLKDFKHLLDIGLQHRINPLIEDLHQYLCRVGYPGYGRDCGCDSKGTRTTKRSDFILNIYDTGKKRRIKDDCCDDRYISSSNGSGNVTGPSNETIPFSGVDHVVVNWTTTRKNKFGTSANIDVYILGDDLSYHLTSVEIISDSDTNPTFYRVNLTGDSTGYLSLG